MRLHRGQHRTQQHPTEGAHVRACNVGGSIDEPNQVRAVVGTFVNAEGGGERQVGTVAPLLIPALDSRADRARGDGEVERLGDPPLVRDLSLETKDFGLVEFEFPTDGLELIRVLCDQGTFFEVPYMLGEALFFHK